MENAAKALLMAGGVLIALLIVGALMLMFNQVGSYQQSESGNLKNAQLAEFNNEYTQYIDEINGYELISLMNRVVDYNVKKPDIGNDFAYKEITINVKLGKFGRNSGYFDQSYNIKNKESRLYQQIVVFRSLETKNGLSTMSKLSANYDSIIRYQELVKNGTPSDQIDIELGKSTREFIERFKSINPKIIEQYREYSEFKKIKLKPVKDEYYDNGQIKQIDYEYIE